MHIDLPDIKQIDGEPYEVAQIAGDTLEAALTVALDASESFEWAARGAWLTMMDHVHGEMPDQAAWEASPQCKVIVAHRNAIQTALRNQRTLTRSAAWNPKTPLTAG